MTTSKRRSARSGRKVLRSPGRPPVGRREHRRVFWSAIAAGCSSEDAAVDAGVSPPVGARWFREAGGMPQSHLAPAAKSPSGRYLSFVEREEIALLCARGHGVREIARRLGRAPATISRELRRNAATRGGGLEYRATTAQWHADRSARRPKPAKLAVNAEAARLCAGSARRPDRRAGRQGYPRAECCLEGPADRAPAGPKMGEGLEPGADRPPAQARLPRGQDHARQPRGYLPVPVRPRARRA